MGRIEIPSYGTGFARCAAESEYPERWEGLVAAWCPFLGPSGLKLFDVSGRKNHGTLTNMDPATDWVLGRNGYVLDLAGDNDYVDCGNEGSLSLANKSFTVEVRTKRASSGDYDYVVGQGSVGATNKGLHIGYRFTNKYTIGFYGDDCDTLGTYTDVDTWIHWVVTYDSSTKTQSIYRNGTFENSRTANNHFSGTADTVIGKFPIGGIHYSDGMIGSVAVYNRTFPVAEIADHYAVPHGLVQPRRKIWAIPWIPMFKVNDGLVNAGLSGGLVN